ncbi:hypothetical protein EVAR_77005_1 [Eumeta japonica]|uniref:Zinc finger HIT domain-containing protein 2 n=1 Tax=Eumeta variegata TaxID=151549 RepID=A0A4C1SHE3_EUMVA|nr:hypothetical protein EVAR_77005_1 [Eumeta japonica]
MQEHVDDCIDLNDTDLRNSHSNEQSDIDSDDNEYIDLEERIKSIDLDDADAVWEALNEDERNEFEALLNKGDIESIVPQWIPWWLYQKKVKVIEEVDANRNEEQAALKECPLVKDVPKLSSLTVSRY